MAGAVVTAPARSPLLATPSLSTATVTPLPWDADQALVIPSEASHHSWCRTWSAEAGTVARPIEIAAAPVAIRAMTGRGNLSGTPSLPSMLGTRTLCHVQAICVLSERIHAPHHQQVSWCAPGLAGRALRAAARAARRRRRR